MRRFKARRVLLSAAFGFLASPAFAADTNSVADAACIGGLKDEELRRRMAEVVLNQVGALGSAIAGDSRFDKDMEPGERALRIVESGELPTAPYLNSQIKMLREDLEQDLASSTTILPGNRKINVENAPVWQPQQHWLFVAGQPLKMTCTKPKMPDTIAEEYDKPTARPRIVLREKIDELGATGDTMKKAGAARIGVKRVRTAKDDGSHKTTTSFGFTGTLGFRVTSDQATAPVFLYGSYALSRERTKPSDPTKKQSDGDVHGLEAGVALSDVTIFANKEIGLTGSLRGAYVFDFAHDARRLKVAGSIVPGIGRLFAPLCDIGGFADVELANFRVRTRCLIAFEVEGSHVIDAGSFDFKDRGEFLSAGGRLQYQLAVPMGQKIDVIGSIGYRYLPTLAGRAPDIKRWDASIKYRLWTDAGLGLDFGLTWAKGQDPITYAKEDKLELGFGIIR